MKDAQSRLDKGARALMTLIKQAERGATEACEAGDAASAAKLHRMAAHMRLAYAEGRELSLAMPGGEIITPQFGGDK